MPARRAAPELGLVTGPDSRDFPGPQASWPRRALGRSTGPDRRTPIASEPTPAFGAGYGDSASPGGLSQRTSTRRALARDQPLRAPAFVESSGHAPSIGFPG